jgi:hypothetical protein
MNLYIVCGAPGMGKSPFIRKLIGDDSTAYKNRCFVFDIANEYGQRVKYAGQKPLNLSNNANDLRCRYIGTDLKKFIEICDKKKDTICVFEEATGFFQGMVSKETTRLIINRYHTGNTYCFIFHSINSIPPRIMEIANYVVLFKTNDEAEKVYSKYSRLGSHFDHLQSEPNGTCQYIKLL